MLDDCIKNWYLAEFKDDDLGEEIKDNVTFRQLGLAMIHGQEVYSFLGVGDSVIRERCFSRLSDLLNVNYEVIYQLWIRGTEINMMFTKLKEEK